MSDKFDFDKYEINEASDILKYPELRNSLLSKSRDRIIRKIQIVLTNRVKEAYLFGSFATDKIHPDSDIDIILIQETTTNFIDRGKEFLDLTDIFPAMDIIVYTPQEFQRKQKDSVFQKNIAPDLLKIY